MVMNGNAVMINDRDGGSANVAAVMNVRID